jgi:hypothetical protein
VVGFCEHGAKYLGYLKEQGIYYLLMLMKLTNGNTCIRSDVYQVPSESVTGLRRYM